MTNEHSTRSRSSDGRRLPETKTFLATSEFWVSAIAIAALLAAAYVLNDLRNVDAWRFATWVAIAYVVSRGIAKAGSQRNYTSDDSRWARDRDTGMDGARRADGAGYAPTERVG